jgi:hypothetical protein
LLSSGKKEKTHLSFLGFKLYTAMIANSQKTVNETISRNLLENAKTPKTEETQADFRQNR